MNKVTTNRRRMFSSNPGSAYEDGYLTFISVTKGTFSFDSGGIEYTLNNGKTWTTLDANSSTPSVAVGSKISFRGNKTSSGAYGAGIGWFQSTGSFNVEGNIMCLLYGDNFKNKKTIPTAYVFTNLFNSAKVKDASKLLLPATTLKTGCYLNFFLGSTITTPPTLPATTLTASCYEGMFANCASLTTAPSLPSTSLATGCYINMFMGCTTLKKAPKLMASSLPDQCYKTMFGNCTSLNYIYCMATSSNLQQSGSNCPVYNWVTGVQTDSGNFYYKNGSSWSSGSTSGIPHNWTRHKVS